MNIDFSERTREWSSTSPSGYKIEIVVFNAGGALLQVFDGVGKITHVTLDAEQIKRMTATE